MTLIKIQIIFEAIMIAQIIITIISITLLFIEAKISKTEFGSGSVFILLLTFFLIPLFGLPIAFGGILDSINNIRTYKQKKKQEETNR